MPPVLTDDQPKNTVALESSYPARTPLFATPEPPKPKKPKILSIPVSAGFVDGEDAYRKLAQSWQEATDAPFNSAMEAVGGFTNEAAVKEISAARSNPGGIYDRILDIADAELFAEGKPFASFDEEKLRTLRAEVASQADVWITAYKWVNTGNQAYYTAAEIAKRVRPRHHDLMERAVHFWAQEKREREKDPGYIEAVDRGLNEGLGGMVAVPQRLIRGQLTPEVNSLAERMRSAMRAGYPTVKPSTGRPGHPALADAAKGAKRMLAEAGEIAPPMIASQLMGAGAARLAEAAVPALPPSIQKILPILTKTKRLPAQAARAATAADIGTMAAFWTGYIYPDELSEAVEKGVPEADRASKAAWSSFAQAVVELAVVPRPLGGLRKAGTASSFKTALGKSLSELGKRYAGELSEEGAQKLISDVVNRPEYSGLFDPKEVLRVVQAGIEEMRNVAGPLALVMGISAAPGVLGEKAAERRWAKTAAWNPRADKDYLLTWPGVTDWYMRNRDGKAKPLMATEGRAPSRKEFEDARIRGEAKWSEEDRWRFANRLREVHRAFLNKTVKVGLKPSAEAAGEGAAETETGVPPDELQSEGQQEGEEGEEGQEEAPPPDGVGPEAGPIVEQGGGGSAASPAPPADFGTPDAPNRTALASAIAEHIAGGGRFPTIVHLRKFLASLTEWDFPPGHALNRDAEESLQQASIMVARDIIMRHGGDPGSAYGDILALHNSVPAISSRDTKTTDLQQYSTPTPVAAAAIKATQYVPGQRVLDTTAGHGALEIGMNTADITANDLDPQRAQSLRDSGIEHVTSEDAMTADFGERNHDVILANPPFRGIKEGVPLRGDPKGRKAYDMAHVIVANSLAAMTDDGRAFLILKGPTGELLRNRNTPKGQMALMNHYLGADINFWNFLHENYNVVGHATLVGDLYRRMGSSYPIEVVVIHGRKPSSRPTPGRQLPRVVETWEQMKEIVNEPDRLADRDPAPPSVVPPRVPGGTSGRPGDAGRPGKADVPGTVGTPDAEANPPTVPGGGGGEGAGGRVPDVPGSDQGGGVGGSGMGSAGEPDTATTDAGDQAGAPPGKTGEQLGGEQPVPPGGGRGPEQPAGAGGKPAGGGGPAGAADTGGLPGGAGREPYGKRVGRVHGVDPGAIQAGLAAMESGSRDDAVAKVAEIIRQYLAAGGYPTPPAIASALNKAGFGKAVIPLLKDAYAAARGGEQRPLKKRKKPRKESDIRGLASRTNADEEMDWGAVEGFFSDHEGEADSETGVGQVPIQAFSAGRSHGETMPENMVGPITEALADLEAREGKTVDEYVSEKLGLTVEQMLGGEEPMFSASQVDRLALAIAANENGRSFIDASGTGMGKGRVAAALIRYAKRRGLLPIFVTWDPPLYKDMLERDLPAVGMPESELGLVVPTNNALNLMRDDGTPYRVPNPSRMLEEIADSIAAGNPEHFVTVRGKKQRVGAIFTTHSQISPVQGDNPARVEALQRMAPGTMLIVDESHGSAGADSGRGQNMQGLVANSGSTDFASATFAKRPDMLALYSLRSTIRHAVEHAQQIEDMAKKGGRALMEVLASMMGRDGGLYRAEMNMAGVKISVGEPDITAPIAPETVNAFADILAAMRGFDEAVMGALPEIANYLARDQQFLLADKIDLDKTSFISLFHNVVQQALVAIKVDLAADRMIKHINEGRKVFLMLYNTMEAATENIIETLGIQIGDEFSFSVGDLYQRALRRCRTISVKPIDRDGNSLPAVHLYLSDDLLAAAAPHLLEMFNRVSDRLSTNPELGALPGSPIDWLEHRLRLAGIDFYEATGRKSRFVYSGDGMKGAIFPREASETGVQARVAAISRYNGKAGQQPLHAIIANPSASTGISAHASPGTGTDHGRQRVGLILQPVHDVAIFLQMLGRINRMGQTLQPAYEFVLSSLPVEQRSAAILLRKLRSLNAIATAKSGGHYDVGEDILSGPGDQSAYQVLLDNPPINMALGPDSGSPLVHVDDENLSGLAAKATGRAFLLSYEDQQLLIDGILADYRERLAQYAALGIDPFSTTAVRLGEIRRFREVTHANPDAADSVFGAASVAVDTDVITRVQNPSAYDLIGPAVANEGRTLELPRGASLVSPEGLRAVAELYSADQLRNVLARLKGLTHRGARIVLVSEDFLATLADSLSDTDRSLARMQEWWGALAELADNEEARFAWEGALILEAATRSGTNDLNDIPRLIREAEDAGRKVGSVDSLRHLLVQYVPGKVLQLNHEDGDSLYGVVTDLRCTKGANPALASSWRMKLWVANPVKSLTIRLTQTMPKSADAVPEYEAWPSEISEMVVTLNTTAGDVARRRTVIRGNVPAAFAEIQKTIPYGRSPGQVAMGQWPDGRTEPVLILPLNYSIDLAAANAPVEMLTVDEVLRSVREVRDVLVGVKDDAVRLGRAAGGAVTLFVPAKARYRTHWFGNPRLVALVTPQNRGGFNSLRIASGSFMVATLRGDDLRKVLQFLHDRGERWQTRDTADHATVRRLLGRTLDTGWTTVEQGGEAEGETRGLGKRRGVRARGPSNKPRPMDTEAQPGATPYGLSDIIKMMEELTGAPIRWGRGHFKRRNAAGWYSPGRHFIRLDPKEAEPLFIACHEVGHALHNQIFAEWTSPDAFVRAQLEGLAQEASDDPVTPGSDKAAHEGVAELIGRWLALEDVDKTRPAAWKWFSESAQRLRPDLWVGLHRLRGAIANMEAAGAAGRVSRMVDHGQGPPVGELATEPRMRRLWNRVTAAVELAWELTYQYVARPQLGFIKYDLAALRAGGTTAGELTTGAAYTAFLKTAKALATAAVTNGVFVRDPVLGVIRLSDPLTPVFDWIAAGPEGTFDRFGDYLAALQWLDNLEKGLPAGVTKADAEHVVEEFEAEFPDAREMALRVAKWNNAHLEMLMWLGRIPVEEYNRMIRERPMYHPTLAVDVPGGKGKGGRKGLARRHGHTGRIVHPLVASLIHGRHFFVMAQEQQVVNRLYETLAEVQERRSGLRTQAQEKEVPVPDWYDESMGQMISPAKEGDYRRFHLSASRALKELNKQGIISDQEYKAIIESADENKLAETNIGVWQTFYRADDGKFEALLHRRIVVRDPETGVIVGVKVKKELVELSPVLWRSFNLMAYAPGNTYEVLKWTIGIWSRLARFGQVSASPGWAVAQPLLDAPEYATQTPASALTGGYWGRPMEWLWRMIAHSISKAMGGPGDPYVSKVFESGGGENTLLDTRTYLSAGNSIEKYVAAKRGVKDMLIFRFKRPLAAAQGAMNTVTAVLSSGDAMFRGAEFLRVVRERGEADALKRGRELSYETYVAAMNAYHRSTVDFRGGGPVAMYANLIDWPIQAAINSYVRRAEWIKEKPWTNPEMIGRILTLQLVTLIYWAFRRDDDDYQEQPAWLKNGYWTLAGEDGETGWFVPRDREYGFIICGGLEALLNSLDQGGTKPMAEYLAQAAKQLSPPMFVHGIGPFIELWANKDTFTGREIEPGYQRQTLPKSEIHTVGDTAYATALARRFGDELGLSAPQIDHIIDGLSGEVASKWWPLAAYLLGKEDTLPRGDRFFTGRFQLSAQPNVSRRDLFAEAEEALKAWNKSRLEAERGEGELDEAAYIKQYRLNSGAEVVRAIQMTAPDGPRFEPRFEVERYATGLARHILGREPLNGYPNPLTEGAVDLPPGVQTIRDHRISTLLGYAMQRDPGPADPEKRRQWAARVETAREELRGYSKKGLHQLVLDALRLPRLPDGSPNPNHLKFSPTTSGTRRRGIKISAARQNLSF